MGIHIIALVEITAKFALKFHAFKVIPKKLPSNDLKFNHQPSKRPIFKGDLQDYEETENDINHHIFRNKNVICTDN